MSRVVLAMSGGVDSSVAAHLLLEAGHDVIGVFMRHGEHGRPTQCQPTQCQPTQCQPTQCQPTQCQPTQCQPRPVADLPNSREDHKQGCCSASDAEDARRVADLLDIPFYALDLQAQFNRIIDYFVGEYLAGRTPNPCIACNQWLKFGKLFDYADSVQARYVATGHYAQCVVGDDGMHWLCRGVDRGKDQSYALFGVARSRLERVLLPVGQFHKARIRELATGLGLRVADKRDSQEICFVTSGKHGEFVGARRRGLDTSGNIVTAEGDVVGRHAGIERFTIGQRKGLGVAMGEPYFVVRIDPQSHDVVIGRHGDLARQRLTARNTNWLAAPPERGCRCLAQIRYNSRATAATARVLEEGCLEVIFDEPTYGVAPGQAVVCYQGDRILGGGWIE